MDLTIREDALKRALECQKDVSCRHRDKNGALCVVKQNVSGVLFAFENALIGLFQKVEL
jgi:hypothetical protein